MSRYEESKRCAAMRNLPPLPRGLFLLRNFYDVEIDVMAKGLAAETEAIASCLAEARAMIHRYNPYTGTDRFDPEKTGLPIARLEMRLRGEYRQHLESNFAESGYAGEIEWPDLSADIVADEEAAAAFVVAFLSTPLRAAVIKVRRTGIAIVELWRFAWPWRRLLRDRLLQTTGAVRRAGWMPFDEWLANRIAPDRHYPEGYSTPKLRRRPLPEEMPATASAPEENCSTEAPSEMQRRFDSLPSLTQDVWMLHDRYGRSNAEISKRLGIGRRSVRRRIERAIYAILDAPPPSLVSSIRFDLRIEWAHQKRKFQNVLDALRY